MEMIYNTDYKNVQSKEAYLSIKDVMRRGMSSSTTSSTTVYCLDGSWAKILKKHDIGFDSKNKDNTNTANAKENFVSLDLSGIMQYPNLNQIRIRQRIVNQIQILAI